MQIEVTKHALQTFKQRTWQHELPDEEALKAIQEMVSQGRIVHSRPGDAYEIRCKDCSFVVRFEKGKTVVITFLGDSFYRRWHRHTETRLRYGGAQRKPAHQLLKAVV